MIKCVISENKQLKECSINTKNNWIILTDPTAFELNNIAQQFDIDMDFLQSPLDPEEASRIEFDEDVVMIIVNASIESNGEELELYEIIPVGILILKDHIITISSQSVKSIDWFLTRHISNVETFKTTRFTLQILNQIAAQYLIDLKQIDRKTQELEKEIYKQASNDKIIELLTIEKTLVYFRIKLAANQIVLRRIARLEILKKYEEDEELLEDALIEVEQAVEMSQINATILKSIRDAIAAITNNNLNTVMKRLAVLTLVLSIPTIIFSLFGMNVDIFMDRFRFASVYIVAMSISLALTAYLILRKKGFFQ